MEMHSTRRQLLRLAGGAGAALVAGCASRNADTIRTAVARAAPPARSAAAGCALDPEVTEGPYWISNHLTRRDIRDGRPGLPLTLDFTVQDATTCKPIGNADVEVWQADAGGVYSGFSGSTPPGGGGGQATPNNSKRFLRGHQKSDANGKVRFVTIFPGWYTGRTPHIHLKVHVGGSVVHTGQVFFNEATADGIYKTGAYSSHGQPDTSHASDSIYAQAGASRATMKLRRRRKQKGYIGSIGLDVKS
jgi:protocatechuate 3,4-dioxygenase beta subunit